MRVRLPDGATSLGVGGQEYPPDAEGCVRIDDTYAADALRLDCVPVGDETEASVSDSSDAAGSAAEGADEGARGGRRGRGGK
jgi:hypothetical protein